MTALHDTLRAAGQRVTTQREAIYAVLETVTTHPTAEELFFLVRARKPGISLATIYNTLEALSACGLVTKLPGDGVARYEVAQPSHGHARCVNCGAMADLSVLSVPDPLRLPAGFTPRTVQISVEGVCAECGKDAESSEGDDHA